MNRLIQELWTSPPANICDRVRQRARRLLKRSSWDWDYSLRWVLNSPKHMNSKGHLETWERYWRVLGTHGCSGLRQEFGFHGKSVMELGCGPLLGFGPIAIFHGAKEYYYHEPALVRNVVESSQMKSAYFFPMYEELVANYGDKMGFGHWYERIIEDAAPVSFDETKHFDHILSNSVLQHIPTSELKVLLQQLWRLLVPGGWFVHGIDFGAHGLSGGLQRLYETTDRQTQDRGLINLLRLSEMEKELVLAHFELVKSAVYKFDRIDRGKLHASWNLYSSHDLGTRVAIIVGRSASICESQSGL